MTQLSPGNARALRHAATLLLTIGPLGWIMCYLLFRLAPGQDWMVFDTALQAWRHGNLPLLLDGTGFTAVLNETHANWLQAPLLFHPWVYPPYTLLLALPFAALPYGVSYISFQVLTLAGLILALWPWCPPGYRRALLVCGVLLCPATAFTIGAGQDSFLFAGLALVGFHIRIRRPIAAGALLGLLSFKPQLAILVPVALAACGAWRSMMAAAGTCLILLLASLVAPGLDLWRGWLHLFLGGDPAFQTWVNQGRLHGQSVFACLRLLGVPSRAANMGQMVALGLAAGWVWAAFRRALPAGPQLAVLLCGIILGAAHEGNYDAVMLGIAATLVLLGGFERPFLPGEALLAMCIWASSAVSPPFVFYVSAVTPLLVLAMMVRLVAG